MPEKQSQLGLINKLRKVIVLLLVLVGGIIIGGVGMGVYWLVQNGQNTSQVTERTISKDDGNKLTTAEENVIANVVDKVSPSVVSIVTNVTTQSIFGLAEREAAGTGIIVSKDGYILTNKHVINGASKVEIIASDGTTYTDVKIVGTDPLNDVAYLKIGGVTNLSPAVLGDSSTVRVGQGIIAIGNSLGQYQNTVTSGIVSGKGRPVAASDGTSQSTELLTDLLQTDAAINPGNSGGPLLNRTGQVIGINTAVAANAEGIGFAIPINATKGALKSVLAGKGVQRSYLGLTYAQITADVAERYKLSVKQGAYVMGSETAPAVRADSPADKAGIKEKDIITKINGLIVGTQGSISSLIGEYAPGDTIMVTLLRDGKELEVKVTLGTFNG